MERLPTELLVKILHFVDIPAKVTLARCNLTLQQRIYRDCSDAWTEMNFSSTRLTDLELSTLLIRINAREVLQHLDLNGCSGIRGTGLYPLRHSRVIETVKLWGTGADESPISALWALRNSIPFQLRNVELRMNWFVGDDKSAVTTDFMQKSPRSKTSESTRQGIIVL